MASIVFIFETSSCAARALRARGPIVASWYWVFEVSDDLVFWELGNPGIGGSRDRVLGNRAVRLLQWGSGIGAWKFGYRVMEASEIGGHGSPYR